MGVTLHGFHQTLAHPPVPVYEVPTRPSQSSSIGLSAASVSQSSRAAQRRYSRAERKDFAGAVIGAAASPPQAHSRRGSGALDALPLRREARVRKPSRRRLPSPPEVKKLVADRPPISSEAGSDLAQLRQLLTQCLGLSKEVTKPDAEWARELLQQIRTELERQRREQRKALQQLIADIRELREKTARRTPPPEPAAKSQRPLSVEVCPDEEPEPETHATAVFLVDSKRALRLLVGMHSGATAESRSSPRATGSLTELAKAPPRKSRSRSRSARASPPPSLLEIRLVGESDSVPGAGEELPSHEGEQGVPSDAAVQSAVRQLIALSEAARQMGAPAARREVEQLEDAPRNRRGRQMQEDFVPALWRGVRHSSLRCGCVCACLCVGAVEGVVRHPGA